MSEDRCQSTDDRRQRSEDRGQNSDDGRQTTDDSGQKSDDGRQMDLNSARPGLRLVDPTPRRARRLRLNGTKTERLRSCSLYRRSLFNRSGPGNGEFPIEKPSTISLPAPSDDCRVTGDRPIISPRVVSGNPSADFHATDGTQIRWPD